MSALRKIIHVDMDAFFASVEQRDDPALRGRPVAVGGGGQRGVVAAASYEARAFGVRSAMPGITARRRCPDLVFARPRFEVYRQVSQQIRAIFLDYTDLVEPLSLDEAYLDVTENRRGLSSATATAEEIRARIRAETGLTASAGVSYNKLLAKLASDQRKPDGLFVVPPGQGATFVAGLEIGRLHGIGPRTAEKLHALGIRTGADLARADLAFLTARFGKAGGWFHRIARGEDERRVSSNRERKSSGSERTFSEDVTDWAGMEAGVRAQAASVWQWVERTGISGRTVTLKVKYQDFRQITRARTLRATVASEAALAEVALSLARGVMPLRAGVRLIGVTLSHLEARDTAEPELALLPLVQPGGGDPMTDPLNTGPMNPGDAAPEGTPNTGENVCPVCGGDGKVDGETCHNCNGLGTVIVGISGG
ncbi:DNA polymerase-4 [Sphingomonas jatrophae]|uniref:DNA polymerase IV n=1 Tax=Sphingomonas jatrophae TaxID=1166337 RepID=A0A1I6JE15_9SPHN|nr:DNA polymerase-4 [Sphingomonas jatrophae]